MPRSAAPFPGGGRYAPAVLALCFALHFSLYFSLWGPAVHAHHSFAAVYDSEKQLTIAGVVTEFAFIHPHPFLFMSVADETEQGKVWRLEMDNRFELVAIGMTAETLKPGDRVVATGSVGRSQPRILYLRLLVRPADGFRYEQVGSTPSISVQPRSAVDP